LYYTHVLYIYIIPFSNFPCFASVASVMKELTLLQLSSKRNLSRLYKMPHDQQQGALLARLQEASPKSPANDALHQEVKQLLLKDQELDVELQWLRSSPHRDWKKRQLDSPITPTASRRYESSAAQSYGELKGRVLSLIDRDERFAKRLCAFVNEYEADKAGHLWKKKLAPVLLRMRVASAFEGAAMIAHARAHAVDEEDFDRTGQPPPSATTDTAMLLGAPRHSWQRSVAPLILKLRVARAFRERSGEVASGHHECEPPAGDGLDGGSAAAAVAEEADDWTAEDAELPPQLEALVDSHVATARAELMKGVQLEAAKWLVGNQLLPPSEKKPELAATIGAFLSIKMAGLAAGRPKPPEFGDRHPESQRRACVSSWRQRLASTLAEMRSPAICSSARETAEPWCAAFLAAKREVMDPNEKMLTAHFEGVWTEQVGAAKWQLEGSRLRDVMQAHACAINGSLKAAMDNVESQFCEAMRPLIAATLGPPAPLDPDQLTALILAGIRSFRVGFDKPWGVKTLEKQLTECMALDQAEKDAAKVALDAEIDRARPQPMVKASTDMHSEPVGYLLGLVLGCAELPLETPVREWLATACADYLDPFIDGDVPAAQYQARSEGWFLQRLRALWAARPDADGSPLPVSARHALAAYAAHTICKLNAQLGFGSHTPGLGRQPVSDTQAAQLHQRLGVALVEAIARDFDEADRGFGSLEGGLRPENIVHVARIHLNGLIAYQNELGGALALANRGGEEARREERMKIWGRDGVAT
jgi:hypothetical protein